MRIILPIVLAFSASVAIAQTTGDAQRGNTPPGMSQDGARPADGAIQGGTAILPGEKGGLPNKEEAKQQRCHELTGSLREECLKKERDGSAGAGGTMPSTPRESTEILKK